MSILNMGYRLIIHAKCASVVDVQCIPSEQKGKESWNRAGGSIPLISHPIDQWQVAPDPGSLAALDGINIFQPPTSNDNCPEFNRGNRHQSMHSSYLVMLHRYA